MVCHVVRRGEVVETLTNLIIFCYTSTPLSMTIDTIRIQNEKKNISQ